MAEMIAIVGQSGSGKTSSIRNLNPEETFIITTTGKRPGIPGTKKKYPNFNPSATTKEELGNFLTTDNVNSVDNMIKVINSKMKWIKYLIIDDYDYFMSFETMDRAAEKGYTKFSEIAQHAYQIMKGAMSLRDDLYVIILSHQDNEGDKVDPYYRMKTTGKMIDNLITLEGLFTYVLFTDVSRDEDGNPTYKFKTNSDGTCTAKTPMGMFPELLIDNDLNLLINRIKEYNDAD